MRYLGHKCATVGLRDKGGRVEERAILAFLWGNNISGRAEGSAALFGTFRVSKQQYCEEAALGQESNIFQNIPARIAVTRDYHWVVWGAWEKEHQQEENLVEEHETHV